MKSRIGVGLATLGVAGAMLASGLAGVAGTANAASKTGWVGPAGTTGYLHTSTIINAPDLTAESKIYHSFGATAAADTIGVRPRLFKSGALCEAIDYEFNWYSSPSWTARTSATCGSGWYNSHGFVAVWNASTASFNEYVTFPSDPLQWTAPPAARSASTRDVAVSDADRQKGQNSKGQTFGPANGGQENDPALILTIGENGKVGYVKSSELNRKPSRGASKAPRSIAVWDKEANRKIDTFTVG